MAMTVDTDGKFLLKETSATQEYTKELNTAGKYVDRNIKVDIKAKDGALSADVSVTSGSASMTASGFTADTGEADTGYSVNLATTSGSATGKANVSTAGWVDSADNKSSGAKSVSVSGNGSVIKIPKATLTGATSDLTAPKVTVGISSSGITTISKPSSGTEGTDYFSVTATGTGTNGSVKAKATVNKTGMVGANDSATSGATTITPSITGSGSKVYIPKATSSITNGTATVTAGTATTSVTGMKTTTTNTGYAVTASATGGNASVTASSATVNAGYTPKAVTASTTAKTATGETKNSTTYIQKGALGATVSGDITFTPSVSTNGITTITKPSSGTEGTDYFSITGSGTKSGTISGKASVSTEGYVKSETATGGSATGTIGSNAVKYVAKATVSGSATASATTTVAPGAVTISSGSGSVSGKTKLSITPITDTASVSDYYIPLIASAAANSTGSTSSISGSGTATTTEGYAPSGTSGSVSVSGTATAKTSKKDSSNYFISLPKTKYSNTATSGVTYTDISSSVPALVSGGYLYISAGYNQNERISLAKLVPDGASLVGGTSNSIVSGATAYDNDGKLITGSLTQLTVSGALNANETTTAGYDFYIVTAGSGHNKDGSADPVKIPVYQGDWVI